MLREQAYKLVQTHAMQAWETETSFREAIENDSAVRQLLSLEQIAAAFSMDRQLANVDKIFERVFSSVALKYFVKFLELSSECFLDLLLEKQISIDGKNCVGQARKVIVEDNHSRKESRRCSILDAEVVLPKEQLQNWTKLSTLVRVESIRDGVKDERFYISSEKNLSGFNKPLYFNALVRGH